jgi:hypothetical protein
MPDDLTTLSPEDLDALESRITDRGAQLRDQEDLSDDEITELERLANARDLVMAERETRAAAASERAERASAALARLAGEDPLASDTDPDEVDPDVVDDPDEAGDDPDADVEPVEGTDAPQPVAVAASARKPLRRPAAAAPKPSKRRPTSVMHATAFAEPSVPGGTVIESRQQLAKLISDRRSRMGNWQGHREYVSIATGEKAGMELIDADAFSNFAAMAKAARGAEERAAALDGLVASGAFCTPQTPLFDFFQLGEPQTPVESSLNAVQANRGGIRYIPYVDWFANGDAFDGIDTFAHDHDYTLEADQKPCAIATCSTITEAFVTAVAQCVQFGNLQYRTFPEQVEAFLNDVAIAYAQTKEVFYLDYIDSHSTAVTAEDTYGASRTLIEHWTRATTAYRKRHHMRLDAPLEVRAPDWTLNMLKVDMAMDGDEGLSYFDVSDAQVEAALRSRGIDITWFADSPSTNTGQRFAGTQAVGALNSWPTTIRAYICSPGTFIRLDGGTLDVGLVRDSVLNKTNDLQIFMEEWLGIVMLGAESVKLTSNVMPNGAGAALVTPFTST